MSTVLDGVNTVVGFVAQAECNVTDEYVEVPGITDSEKCRIAWGKIKDGKCMRPSHGHGKFRIEFDPNNGWVSYIHIHPDYVNEKTKDITMEHGDRLPWSQNPDYEKYKQPVK